MYATCGTQKLIESYFASMMRVYEDAHTYEQTIYRIPGMLLRRLESQSQPARVFNSKHRKSCGFLPNPIIVWMDIIATASTECILGTVVWNSVKISFAQYALNSEENISVDS